MKSNSELLTLTLNSGSSSVKTKLYRLGTAEELIASGSLERIGLPGGRFRIADAQGRLIEDRGADWRDHAAALQELFDRLGRLGLGGTVSAVGHRVVHGGSRFVKPTRVTPALLEELRRLVPLDPLHLPPEIRGIEAVATVYPAAPQVACFDTSFHCTLPEVAWRFALPRRFTDEGVRRFGFHGLSYEYIVEELKCEKGRVPGRVIVAHLGNGVSMAAVRDGQCIDTTMGLTPIGGLVMGTRSGDLDPGTLTFLMRQYQLTADQLDAVLNNESGLLGLSDRTPDMAELLKLEATIPAAAIAIDVFCYQARKFIGALAAALGGLDLLVFTAGIGERSATVRARICAGLDHLGVTLDAAKNGAGEGLISAGPVAVRVIRTNEELMIARHTQRVLGDQAF